MEAGKKALIGRVRERSYTGGGKEMARVFHKQMEKKHFCAIFCERGSHKWKWENKGRGGKYRNKTNRKRCDCPEPPALRSPQLPLPPLSAEQLSTTCYEFR